jgi:hypothetical protein
MITVQFTMLAPYSLVEIWNMEVRKTMFKDLGAPNLFSMDYTFHLFEFVVSFSLKLFL